MVLSRLLSRVDAVAEYKDLLQDFKEPLPVYKRNTNERDADEKSGRTEDNRSSKRSKTAPISAISQEEPVIGVGAPSSAGGAGSSGKTPPRQSNLSGPLPSADLRSDGLEALRPASNQPQSDLNLNKPSDMSVYYTQSGGGMNDMTQSAHNMLSVTAMGPKHNDTDLPAFLLDDRPWLEVGADDTMSTDVPFHNAEPIAIPSLDNLARQAVRTEPGSKMPSTHEHDAALALEGIAFGREYHALGEPIDQGSAWKPGNSSQSSILE
nr:uncharacterized protein I303_08433 [Kwoniella dejecticola CBS 10117]OBR81051.1 hypothetical protein I303_08433 [Kwoniella dejecticola CBS 10117]